MKLSPRAANVAVVIAITAFVAGNAGAQAPATAPFGWLSASPTVVRTGTYPVLKWNITHPSRIGNFLSRAADGTLTPRQDLYMDVRILGASYQIGTNSNGTPKWGSVESYARADGASSFTRFFAGVQTSINPSTICFTKLCRAGSPIDFRSRCNNGSSWLSYRSTESLTPNVVALLTGESPPDTVPAFRQGSIESFLAPYLDAGGKVLIGPMDVIYLFELGQTNTQSSGFDLQDLVLLVTFRTP